jgi:hypothetical protein
MLALEIVTSFSPAICLALVIPSSTPPAKLIVFHALLFLGG